MKLGLLYLRKSKYLQLEALFLPIRSKLTKRNLVVTNGIFQIASIRA
jgi:hypothetical protein